MNILEIIPCLTGAGAALLLAAVLLRQKPRGSVSVKLTAVLLAIAWIHLFNVLGVLFEEQRLLWRQIALVGEIGLPVLLYQVGLAFMSQLSVPLSPGGIWRFRAILVMAIGLALLVIGYDHVVMAWIPESESIVFKRPVGWTVWSFILTGLVLALSQLEQVLRASRDPLRYQLKFVIIGLGGIAGFSIAQASHLLLLPVWKHEYTWVGGLAALISVGLIAFGLGRWRGQDLGQRVFISHQALYTSFTFLIVGFYLFGVALLAEIIRQAGWSFGEALGIFLFFLGAIVLVTVFFSRDARAQLQVFISRHFYRSKYDYRSKWLELTEAFGSCHSIDGILDQFLYILSRTFGASTVTIWLQFEADEKFHQVRSVNIQPPPGPIDMTHPVVSRLQNGQGPINIHEDLNSSNPSLSEFLEATQAVVCVPLDGSSGGMLGFVTLSRELQGREYGRDDFDLLRAIAHHVNMLLTQAKLMEERSAAAEWEAVHKFSAYYLHDLKNLASGLSLVVQNAETYGHDPEFQSAAMRTISNSVQRIMGLMGRLAAQVKTSGSGKVQEFQLVNINTLVTEGVSSMNGTSCKTEFLADSELPLVSVVPEQFKQLLLNLLLNANQAIGDEGTIEVRTEKVEESVIISIADSGPGIPTAQLRTLFQPFRTIKTAGLGLGLYQCKQIVEQHKGKLRLESREGEGTRVIIALPVADEK